MSSLVDDEFHFPNHKIACFSEETEPLLKSLDSITTANTRTSLYADAEQTSLFCLKSEERISLSSVSLLSLTYFNIVQEIY